MDTYLVYEALLYGAIVDNVGFPFNPIIFMVF
jgi:hypothetical protein